ncbi:hypothetical protein EDB86DRAFT_2049676 [Lactarius hatsudake]|nr:hypothetical protein EDB86DRAFT_2049676 [Lactarius hatsudake]
MAYFRLWYFIEGTSFVHCVTISKYKYVADLQSEIHSQSERSHFKGVPLGDLALLKLDIDLESHHYGDGTSSIQDWRAPDDSETLDVTQRIREIWRHRPDSEPLHLHICVRRPSTAISKLLDTALHLHCNLWGKDLQGLLKSSWNICHRQRSIAWDCGPLVIKKMCFYSAKSTLLHLNHCIWAHQCLGVASLVSLWLASRGVGREIQLYILSLASPTKRQKVDCISSSVGPLCALSRQSPGLLWQG